MWALRNFLPVRVSKLWWRKDDALYHEFQRQIMDLLLRYQFVSIMQELFVAQFGSNGHEVTRQTAKKMQGASHKNAEKATKKREENVAL